MALRFYNSYSKKLENFKPVKGKNVRIYNCGPTVYDYAHIGNFRSFIFADVLRRYLEYKGYSVQQVMNITDVGHLSDDDLERGEDKIQKKAKEKKISPFDIARFYEKEFLKDSKDLNLKEPYKRPRATDHIKEMQELIKVLLKKGFAYEVNGSVYYDISKFKEYGKLSGNTVERIEEGKSGRELDSNKDKKNFYDFSLWVNDPEHLMYWKSPWSQKGYPGWHIECSVMSMKWLSDAFKGGKFNPSKFETIDIHTGGEDNIFPHHEAEISQTKGATGKDFANFWLHVRHLFVDGEKMSKRTGNFYTLRDIYSRGFSAQQFRFFMITKHYRTPFNFTFDSFSASNKNLQKILSLNKDLKFYGGNGKEDGDKIIKKAKKDFEKLMDDDLNVSGAIATILEFVSESNKLISTNTLSKKGVKSLLKQLKEFDNILGILDYKEEIPVDILKKVAERETARKKKDWAKSDRIRDELASIGYEVKDSADGPNVVVKFKIQK